jgi:hypothetical protein
MQQLQAQLPAVAQVERVVVQLVVQLLVVVL